MNDIINFFNLEINDDIKFDEYVNYLEKNNLKFDLNVEKFKKFDNFKKKKNL